MMEFPGMWRGMVVDNIDPEVKGRIKIYVPGVYPAAFSKETDKLPWAEPAMSIFGGSGNYAEMGLNQETGVCSVPHANKDDLNSAAQVWLFFEQNDIQKPVYFAICQSGAGWFVPGCQSGRRVRQGRALSWPGARYIGGACVRDDDPTGVFCGRYGSVFPAE